MLCNGVTTTFGNETHVAMPSAVVGTQYCITISVLVLGVRATGHDWPLCIYCIVHNHPSHSCWRHDCFQVLWRVLAGNIIHSEVETRELLPELASASSTSTQIRGQSTWGEDTGHWIAMQELGKLAMISNTSNLQTGECLVWCWTGNTGLVSPFSCYYLGI